MKFSDFLVQVELARCFLRLCKWPDMNTHSFCHGSIQMLLGTIASPDRLYSQHHQELWKLFQRPSAYRCVFLPAFASPSPVLCMKTSHLCSGVFVWDTRIPFFMAVTQSCFIICLTHQHPGSFKVKLKCIRPSVPLYFHLVRTSEGPKMSLRATCGILERDANSKRMLASGERLLFIIQGHQRRQQTALICAGEGVAGLVTLSVQNNPL